MALSDHTIPIIASINDAPSNDGDATHPNESLLCANYNALINEVQSELDEKLNLNGSNILSGRYVQSPQIIPFISSLNLDLSLSNSFHILSISGDLAINAPTNGINNQEYELILISDNVAGHEITFNTIFSPSDQIIMLADEIIFLNIKFINSKHYVFRNGGTV